MSIFCYKKLDATIPLKEKFSKARAERNLTIEGLAHTIRIPEKYLLALEEANYSVLPSAKPYRLAYVREYAKALGLSPKGAVEQFILERGLLNGAATHPHRTLKLFPFSSISIFLRNGVLIAGVLLFGVYLTWQIHHILQPPHLTVYSPLEGYTARQLSTLVQGETEKGTQLTVNGESVMVNPEGQFQVKIDLTTGVNTIVVEATKKHGKKTSVTRHLVVQPRGKTAAMTLKKNGGESKMTE